LSNKQTIWAKSENYDAKSEKFVSENIRTFAAGNEKRVLRKLKRVFIFKSLERDLTVGDTRLHLSKTSKLDCVRFARALQSKT
jgi:hypothetical protein